jgi:hypothetical protein
MAAAGDNEAIYGNPNVHDRRSEPSGERPFFAMPIAFGVVLATIFLGLSPDRPGIAPIFAVLGIVLALAGVFLARLLDDR